MELRIIGIVLTTFVIMYLIKKLVESIANLTELWKTGRDPGGRSHLYINKGGIVLNKKTKKLEADNRPIVPF